MRTTYKKKNLFLGLAATLAIGSVGFGLAFVNPVSANAEEKTFYSTGTQLNAQEEQVRFNATLTESEYAKYFDENGVAKAGTQTGMLILPWDLFDGNGMEVLNLETYASNQNLVQNVDTTNLWSENGEGGYEAWAKMNGSIIGEKNYNRALYYVCYVTDGTTAQYTEAQKTSMSYEALLAQSLNISEDTKAELAEKYMLKYSVTFKDAYARTMSVQYGTKFSEMTSRELTDLYWDAEYTQQVSASDYITCNSTIYMKAEDQNTAELMSFDYACDVMSSQTYISDSYKPTISWLPEFEGEKGVMKVESNNATKWAPQFTLVNPKQSIAEGSSIYENYDYVVVRMYIAKGVEIDGITYDGDWDYVCVENTKTTQHKLTETSYNCWITVKMKLSDVLTANSDTKLKILGADAAGVEGTNSLWYIADVSLHKIADGGIEFTSTDYSNYVKIKNDAKTGGSVSWNYAANAVQLDYEGGKYVGATLTDLTTLWTETEIAGYDYFTVEIFYVAVGVDPYDKTKTVETSLDSYIRYNSDSSAIVACQLEAQRRTLDSDEGKWLTLILPIQHLTDSIRIYEQQGANADRVYVRNMQLRKAELEVSIPNADALTTDVAMQSPTVVDENGTTITTNATVCYTRFGGESYHQAIGKTYKATKTGTWHVIVITKDGKVGFTKVKVAAAETTA